jgi:hypothetical protein
MRDPCVLISEHNFIKLCAASLGVLVLICGQTLDYLGTAKMISKAKPARLVLLRDLAYLVAQITASSHKEHQDTHRTHSTATKKHLTV